MLLIVVLKGTNFKKSNDHNLLLSLPLSKTTIVLSKILKDLVKKEEYEILLDEFNSHITNESIFAYMCDKIECDIQMKLYEDLGCNDLNKEDLKPLKNKKIQELIDNGSNTIADIFIEYDKELYKDNKVFLSILDYIKKNNLKDLLEIE